VSVACGAVAANLSAVRASIARACDRAGRDPGGVALVAVTKGVGAAAIREAVAAGARVLGENRVQEAEAKFGEVPGAVWHLIGHLQRNKVRRATGAFALIQSVDGVPLAEAVARAASARGIVQDVLLQVNLAATPGQSGAAPGDLDELYRICRSLEGLRVLGLMCIAPPSDDREECRPVFRSLRGCRDRLRERWGDELPHLSMGMSDDYPVAVEEGATLVRIGRAIFGSRS
jgi:pyridoxal phosphate enzyme (YggS family)